MLELKEFLSDIYRLIYRLLAIRHFKYNVPSQLLRLHRELPIIPSQLRALNLLLRLSNQPRPYAVQSDLGALLRHLLVKLLS